MFETQRYRLTDRETQKQRDNERQRETETETMTGTQREAGRTWLYYK